MWPSVIRVVAPFVLLAALGGAPMQCSGGPDPAKAPEETPGEALYQLAQEFRSRGDEAAWRQTLEHLIARYPSSRFAVAARQDLADAGVAAPADGAAPGTE